MAIVMSVHEPTDDPDLVGGPFPDYPIFLICDRCGHRAAPWFPPTNSPVHLQYASACRRIRMRYRNLGWVAPGAGGYDLCPSCEAALEREAVS